MSFRKPCQMPFRKLIQPFTLTVAYESFKSKLTSYSPVNPVSVRGRLRECKNPAFVCELKRGFAMAVVSRAIRYLVKFN